MTAAFHAIVLAGERPGGGALARALGLPAGVLAPVSGRPCLLRVLDALDASDAVSGITLCGPARDVVDAAPEIAAVLSRPGIRWLAPAEGPSASAAAGAEAGNGHPMLLTSGDHGLLSAAVVDAFSSAARTQTDADIVVGLVPYRLVAEAFPESRRTVLRFADGAFCGSNLYALLGPASRSGLTFWSSVEAERKRPWRIARRLGFAPLLRYLLRRMKVDEAFATLSSRAGCRVTWVAVPCARAAVDVDSIADWQLADRLIRADAAAGAGRGGAAG